MQVRGGWAAVAALSVPRATAGLAGRRLDRVEAPTREAAIMEACARVDARLARFRAARRPRTEGAAAEIEVPCAEEFADALAAAAPIAAERAMLTAHADSPERCMTAAEIAAAAGYRSFETANARYGSLARRMGEWMGFSEADIRHRKDGLAVWTSVLAEDAGRTSVEGHFVWRMHAPLAEALAAAGWIAAPISD